MFTKKISSILTKTCCLNSIRFLEFRVALFGDMLSLRGYLKKNTCVELSYFPRVRSSGKRFFVVHGSIKEHRVDAMCAAFRARDDTFALGVCNGCQLMALLGWVPMEGVPSSAALSPVDAGVCVCVHCAT